jgi:oligopeptide/dipeptide ABC transporter ATP-binding protein
MDTVGLSQRYVNTYPHELDGGRRQRVGVARALALNPKFIVCDEPVSALDVSIQAQILNLIMDLQQSKGLSYMFITHNLCVVKHISTNIMVMYMGKVVEYTDKKSLFQKQLHPYSQALLSAIPVPEIRQNRERTILTGEVSNPINPKPGCRFAPRCKYVTEKCTGQEIPLIEVESGRKVACTLFM